MVSILILKKIFSNRVSYNVRNFFKLRPNLYLTPLKKTRSVSDFFYWVNDNYFETQFSLMNIGSHILPNLMQKDYIKIFIFDKNGNKLKNLKFLLDDSEVKKINFNDFGLSGSGSFFVFHNLENIDFLNSNKTFISERGYVAYRKKNKIWNFMHGNHNASYLDKKERIRSLMPTSFFYNEYIPQTRFDDVSSFKLIFNNVNSKTIPIIIELYGQSNNLINKYKYYCEYLSTLEAEINEKVKVKYLKVKSKLLFCRPIILKYQKQDFDIYHG